MKAELLMDKKVVDLDGAITEVVVWKVPMPVPPTTHGFKYRLVYVRNGKRIVGFDNERGKGDHMHLGRLQFPYEFTSVAQLIEDFIAEVEKRKLS